MSNHLLQIPWFSWSALWINLILVCKVIKFDPYPPKKNRIVGFAIQLIASLLFHLTMYMVTQKSVSTCKVKSIIWSVEGIYLKWAIGNLFQKKNPSFPSRMRNMFWVAITMHLTVYFVWACSYATIICMGTAWNKPSVPIYVL